MVDAATAAPVFPALMTACAVPDLTRSTAIDMEESFFCRTARSPDSCISTISEAGTISMRLLVSPILSHSERRIDSSPTK